MREKQKYTLRRWWWTIPLVVILVAVAGFAVWATAIPQPMERALAALKSDEEVSVSTGRWLVFRPSAGEPAAGLVFYPGGRVDSRAYAPEAREIAREGFLVVITPMPLNLAVLAPDRAQDVFDAYPTVGRWAVGGHSLGGAMAASFAAKHPAAVQGLVLWASYPPQSADLAESGLEVVSVSGTRDGLATPEKIDASRRLLPASTEWVAIKGGNHAQFGWYGPQKGDNSAAIGRSVQQSQAVEATVDLLSRIARQPE